MEEKKLVVLAKGGDKDAFCMLYSLYKDRLYRYAFYRLENSADAEDAVSECIVAAYKGIGKIRNADAFSAWIFRILYISCCTVMKSQKKRREMADINGTENLITSGMDDTICKTEIQQALDTLKEDEKEIVLLSVVLGLSSKEIAKITDLTSGSVRSKLSRSLKKMREFLESE